MSCVIWIHEKVEGSDDYEDMEEVKNAVFKKTSTWEFVSKCSSSGEMAVRVLVERLLK